MSEQRGVAWRGGWRAPLLAALMVAAMGWTTSAAALDGPLFEDVTAATGLGHERGERVHFADLDGDGRPDAIIERTRIYMNRVAGVNGDTRIHFVRSPHDAPFNLEGLRRADVVQTGDLNGDGLPDLYLGRNTDLSNETFEDDGLRSEVWLQQADGSFARVAKGGVGDRAETTLSALLVDYDKDGVLDLFTAHAYTTYGKGLEAFPDRLYRGKGDGTFDDVTEAAGLLGVAEPGGKHSRRPSYGVAHTDWNDDGWQDLFAMSYGRQWNRLWRNNQDGTFTDVGAETTFDGDAIRHGRYPEGVGRAPEPPFRANGNTFSFAIADVNGDGHMDGFLCEIAHQWAGPSSDRSMLLWNEGPKRGYRFRRAPEAIPARPHEIERWNEGDIHAAWADVDNDGRLDLLLASTDYPDEQLLRLYRQREDGTFEEWTDRLGFRWVNASQLTLGDFDRDGATDVLVARGHNRLSVEQRERYPLRIGLFRNLAAARAGNGFLSLRLRGKGKGHANRDAIGARVSLWIDGARQTREVFGGQGCGGQRNDTEVHFGVGKAKKVDRLEVRWPDGAATVQVFEDVAASRFYQLEQAGDLEVVGGR